jgi:hypothetical protein
MEKDVERTGRSLMSVIPAFARREGGSEKTRGYAEVCTAIRTAVRGENLSKHRVVQRQSHMNWHGFEARPGFSPNRPSSFFPLSIIPLGMQTQSSVTEAT